MSRNSNEISPFSNIHYFLHPCPIICESSEQIEKEMERSIAKSVDEPLSLTSETDAPNIAITATQPWMTCCVLLSVFTVRQWNQLTIEEEVHAFVESANKWRNYLIRFRFTIITVSIHVHNSKIKTTKFFAVFGFYRHRKSKVSNDAFIRNSLGII